MSDYHYMLKLILVGDTSVGKSCIMQQLVEENFDANTDPTIGVEFGVKHVSCSRRRVNIQIWDTAGQESFRYAQQRGIAYVETTATKHASVENAFVVLSREILNRILDGQIDPRAEVGVKGGDMAGGQQSEGMQSEKELGGGALGKSEHGGCC